MMKFHMSILALSLCAVGAISAQAQTSTSAPLTSTSVKQPLAETSTKTTVIPGKDDTTVILRPEGQPQAVIDVNQDILGKSPKKANDATKDATADAKQGIHANGAADAKGDISADVKNKAAAKTTSETTGEGSIKAECVTKTGKESKSVDDTKGKCN